MGGMPVVRHLMTLDNRQEEYFFISHPVGCVPLSKFSLGLSLRTTMARARVGYRVPGMAGES